MWNGYEILVTHQKQQAREHWNRDCRLQPLEPTARLRCAMKACANQLCGSSQLYCAFRAGKVVLLVSVTQLRRELTEQILFTNLRFHRLVVVHQVSFHIAK